MKGWRWVGSAWSSWTKRRRLRRRSWRSSEESSPSGKRRSGARTRPAPGARRASGCAHCAGSGTAISPPWRRRGRCRSSWPAHRGTSAATAKKVQEQAAGSGKDALAEALGRIAELEAELARTRDQLHDAEAENLQRRAKRSRPDLLKGATRRVETPLGTMYVNITEDDKGQPFEVFISLGKAGAPLMADVEAIGRLISLALRSGIPLREVYRQLRGISSDRVVGLGPNKVMSVPDAIGIAIEKWMQDKQGAQQDLLGPAPVPP